MPGIVFVGDLQADYLRLEECHKVLNRVLEVAEDRQADAIVFLGDLKDKYNPVDIRVVRFLVQHLHRMVSRGFSVCALLGNHDRVSMNEGSGSWFPILEKAGVSIFERPGIVEMPSCKLAFLPFRPSPDQIREDIECIRGEVDKSTVVCFHFGLGEALYRPGVRVEEGLSLSELLELPFTYAVGGHLHMRQILQAEKGPPVIYLGTPYTVDWGEANQEKGFAYGVPGLPLEFLSSPLRPWLDPQGEGFCPQEDYEGCRIRVRVSLDHGSVDRSSAISKALGEAELLYPGAILAPVVEVEGTPQVGEGEGFRGWDDDRTLVNEYVEETLPQSLRDRKVEVVNSLLSRLEGKATGRTKGVVHFERLEAENALSFASLSLPLNTKGVHLITGENRDWGAGKGSNGAGKSNTMQLLRVALFGSTTKGQAFDDWRREGSEAAFVRLDGRTESGERWQVERSRPNSLRFTVGGKDFSSGIGRGRTGVSTQEMIEKTLGLTAEVFDHSILIDQKLLQTAESFLRGTDKERKEILDRFLGTRRFAEAMEEAKGEVHSLTHERIRHTALWEAGKARIASLEALLEELTDEEAVDEGSLKAELGKVEAVVKKLNDIEKAIEASRRALSTQASARLIHIAALREDTGKLQTLRESLANVDDQSTCPACGQPLATEDAAANLSAHLQAEVEKVKGERRKHLSAIAEAAKEIREARHRLHTLQTLRGRKLPSRERFVELKEQLAKGQTANRMKQARNRAKAEHSTLSATQLELEGRIRDYEDRLEVLSYQVEALGRGGMVALLYRQVCATLNLASDRYSRLLSDRAIRLFFSVGEEGNFSISLVNVAGGSQVKDQSRGEEQVSALIALLCLREIGPRANLLILDEPAEGLDSENARRIAGGIESLVSEAGTIFLATHNEHLKGCFAGQGEIHVVKENRISRVE